MSKDKKPKEAKAPAKEPTEAEKKEYATTFYIVGFVWLIIGLTNMTGMLPFFVLGIAFIVIAHGYYPIDKAGDLFNSSSPKKSEPTEPNPVSLEKEPPEDLQEEPKDIK